MKWKVKRLVAMILSIAMVMVNIQPGLTVYANQNIQWTSVVEGMEAFESENTGFIASDSNSLATSTDAEVDNSGNSMGTDIIAIPGEEASMSSLLGSEEEIVTELGKTFYLKGRMTDFFPGEIEHFYGSQLCEEAAIIYRILDHLAQPECVQRYGEYSVVPSFRFEGLTYDEYLELYHYLLDEMYAYCWLAMNAYAFDHPQYDLIGSNIKDAYYKNQVYDDGLGTYYGSMNVSFYTYLGNYSLISKSDAIYDVLDGISLSGNTRAEKVKEIHDYLCNEVTYVPHEEGYNLHSAYSALVEKKANEKGYARAFKVMCDYFDIPCVMIRGALLSEGAAEDVATPWWNAVQMNDGKWYGIDVTVDDTAEGPTEEFFLVGMESGLIGNRYHMLYYITFPVNPGSNDEKYVYVKTPEISEENYFISSDAVKIRETALYLEEDNLESKIETLDYAAGNFFYDFDRKINVKNPETSKYDEKIYFSFVAERDFENRPSKEPFCLTVTLPDGLSFDEKYLVSKRVYKFDGTLPEERIWDEIYLLYSEKHNTATELSARFEGIVLENEKVMHDVEFVNLNVVSKTTNIPLIVYETILGIAPSVTMEYYQWHADMFKSETTEYNQQIALLSAYLSEMIENKSVNGDLEARLEQNLKMLGCTNIQYNSYGENGYQRSVPESVFAMKKLVIDGEVKKLVLHSIQGKEDNLIANTVDSLVDWIKYKVAFKDMYLNEYIAACWESYNEYFNNNYYWDTDGIYLITGHDKGGAVAAEFAVRVVGGGVNIGPTYCYTFGAGNSAVEEEAGTGKGNDFIFNIVNNPDVEAFLPRGLDKYGNTLVFHADNRSSEYWAAYMRYWADVDVTDLSGHILLGGCGFVMSVFAFFIAEDKASIFTSHNMSEYINGVKYLEMEELWKEVCKRLEGIDSFHDAVSVISVLSSLGTKLLPKVVKIIVTKPTGSGVLDTVEVTKTVWTTVKDHVSDVNFIMDQYVWTPTRSYRYHQIRCPIDIEILDSAGNIVCSIIDNTIEKCTVDDIGIFIFEDTKEISFHQDSGYIIKILGNDDGSMDYTVTSYTSDNKKEQIINFTDMQVKKGEPVMIVSDKASDGNLEFVNGSEEKMIPDATVKADEFEYVTVQLDANVDTAIVPGKITTEKGSCEVALTITEDETIWFEGWYDEAGNCVSQNQYFTFVVEGDTHYTARYSPVKWIFDDNLEKAILDAGYDTNDDGILTLTELAAIESLDASDYGVEDISGIEYIENLSTLHLDNNSIEDLLPLSELKKLEYLSIHNAGISDISPLANIVSLEELSLGRNNITQIENLKNLVNLTRLDISENKVTDLEVIKNFVNLVYLFADYNPVKAIPSLKPLTKLKYLSIYNAGISDISFVNDLEALKTLHLPYNNISDISPLVNMVGLEELGLAGNKIPQIENLKNLVNLTYLDISENKVTDLEVTKNFVNLVYLFANNNPVKTIPSLKELTRLKLYHETASGEDDYSEPIRMFEGCRIKKGNFVSKFSVEPNDAWYELNSAKEGKYTIYFCGYGGLEFEEQVEAFSEYYLPERTVVRNGYRFTGWNTNEDGSGISYNVNDRFDLGLSLEPNTGVTLYAQWEREYYVISYELYGGTNHMENPDKFYKDSDTITLKAPTLEGHNFLGWISDDGIGEYVTEIKKGTVRDINLFAMWQMRAPSEDDSLTGDGGSSSGGSGGGGGSSSGGSGGGGGSSFGGGGGGGGSSSGGGGGGGGSSSGGGGGGGGSSSSKGGSNNSGSTLGLPSYVIYGTWTQTPEGKWMFTSNSGELYKNKWAAIHNPYANPALGQQMFDWFWFDENGYMITGWVLSDGLWYFMNTASDGTQGRMVTKWHQIDGNWYYFNDVSDGTRGAMQTNIVIDGKYINEQGIWVAN